MPDKIISTTAASGEKQYTATGKNGEKYVLRGNTWERVPDERPQSLSRYSLGIPDALLSLGTRAVAMPINEGIAFAAGALPGGRSGDDVSANPPVGSFSPRSDSGQQIVSGIERLLSPVTDRIAKYTGATSENEGIRNTSHGINAVLGALAFKGAGAAKSAAIPRAAVTDAARTLMDAGVPLDLSQRTGSTFAGRLRSAVADHPITATAQDRFKTAQQKAFNRAVLTRIGEDSAEATQEVMARAKDRIGAQFDRIGADGTVFDDALQNDMARLVDEARATVPESELTPFLKNVDNLLNSVGKDGRIPGAQLTRLRSNLSKLSKNPMVGEAASGLEDALVSSLERSYPGQRADLRNAVTQYRNLKIIEASISKGTERDISPLALSNQLANARNRSMSVYGRGGDQGLVRLAQAGRDVLPEILPNSGTNPRGLANAPLKAIASAPLYFAVQRQLLRQPLPPPPLAGAAIEQIGALPGYSLAGRNSLPDY
jgi:hypothetical protein